MTSLHCRVENWQNLFWGKKIHPDMSSLLVTIFQVTDWHNYNNFIIIIIMQIHNHASSKFLEFSFCLFKATAFKFPSLLLQICMYDINCWSLFNCPALTAFEIVTGWLPMPLPVVGDTRCNQTRSGSPYWLEERPWEWGCYWFWRSSTRI